MSDLLNFTCATCKSGRRIPRPPYPAKILHFCDMVEPGRAFWALVREDYEAPTGHLR